MRPPILYQEGQHRAQRRASARFFAPAVIDGYQPMIADLCDAMLSRLRVDNGRREPAIDAVGCAGDWPGRRSDELDGPRHECPPGRLLRGDPLAGIRSPAGLLPLMRTKVRCWGSITLM